MMRASIFGPERDWTTYGLFLCHFLSTWNARFYEFASILFTAASFPEGLTAASWIGITTSLAIILFASSLGRWVDHAPSRLRTLLTTVSINRVVVIAACLCWSLIVKSGGEMTESAMADLNSATAEPRPLKIHQMKDLLFLVILLLGIAERLSRLANLLSIERDWVPTLAAAGMDTKEPQQYDLTHLNAIMGRIDLICKLGSPIAVSAFMSATESPRLGCFGLMALNLVTWPLEFWTARQVWTGNEQLQELKATGALSDDRAVGDERSHDSDLLDGHNSSLWQHASGLIQGLCSWIGEYGQSLQHYFATEVWMPSLAMSSLHISVLTFSATLTIFLLHSGFSMRLITLAEILSAAFELSSTIVFPWGVHFLSSEPTYYAALTEEPEASETMSSTRVSSGVDDELQLGKGLTSAARQDVGVSRLGMWALGFMLLCLIPAVPAIVKLSIVKIEAPTLEQPSAWTVHPFAVICIILFISASRLGRWTNVLCTQQLAQSCVHPEQRSMFAGTEASLSSTFGLGHWIATVAWGRHDQFHWIVLTSLLVSAGSSCLYGLWLVRRRGNSA